MLVRDGDNDIGLRMLVNTGLETVVYSTGLGILVNNTGLETLCINTGLETSFG